MTNPLRVKFLKSVSDLEGPFGGFSHVYRAPDGNDYLMVAKSQERKTRYHFLGGDVSGNFPNARVRLEYMKTINAAAGEAVCVPAEAA